MTLLEFLKNDVIIESPNDVYIDADHYSEDELDYWIKNYLYPLFDEDEQLFIINYDFKTLGRLKSNLLDEDKYMAKKIVLSALKYRHIPPVEKVYYINDSGSFHVVVKL